MRRAGKAAPRLPAIKPGTNTSFAPLKHVNTGVLSTGYAEAGPADGPVVILLHGWPYDIYSYADVTPLLAAAGYRVIVPYLRGYGTTRFLANDTFRNGQQSVVAVDIIALMDALKIKKAILGGYDWGARTADIIAALWPERCKALVFRERLSDRQHQGQRAAAAATRRNWPGGISFTFATERGRLGYDKYRHDFAKLIWQTASPKWHFDDATFDRSAEAFNNPDHVAVVIHNYRWRIGAAAGDPQYDGLEAKLAAFPRNYRADDHARRRCQRRAASGTGSLCRQVLRQVHAPAHRRRHRPQSAPGSPAGLRAGDRRRRRLLMPALAARACLHALRTVKGEARRGFGISSAAGRAYSVCETSRNALVSGEPDRRSVTRQI
ncbi:MAG: alpha/beta hydrolase [Aliidongia sp.]